MGRDAKAIGTRLRATRIALDFEQAVDFCTQIGVDKGTYSHWESGKRPLTLGGARKIKERFGISLDWLFDGDKRGLSADLYEKIIRIREAA